MAAFTAASLHQSGQNELANYLGFYPIPHGKSVASNTQNFQAADTPINYIKDNTNTLNASLIKDEN